MQRFLADNGIDSIDFLFNNAFRFGDISIAGTKGWFYESGAEDEEKALNREVGRLRRSLQEASKLGGETVAFLHYPPVSNKAAVNELMETVNNTIMFNATGKTACTHDCSTCGGCH